MRDRVALCVTCTVDQFMPEIGVATVRLLHRAGYQVDFPPEQTCCGQPFFNSGFVDEARRLARRTIVIFERHETVVLPAGSCAAMIRAEYSHLFEDESDWQERARKLAAKTYELTEFLLHQARWQPTKLLETQVTYHDSCHMNRILRLQREPRELLQGAGCTVCEMSEADRCCGFGGLFSLRMPEVSNAMTAEKLHQAAETGTTTLVTADPGCLMQMRGLLDDDAGLRIEHIATVLEEATR